MTNGTDSGEVQRPAFKYATHLRVIEDCPPADCQPAAGLAFRFLFDPVGPDGFSVKGERDASSCGAWGVSMYRNERKARKAYERNIDTYGEQWGRANGTHIAFGTLLPSHGMATPPKRQNSHFNLHEFEGANLHAAFTLLGPARGEPAPGAPTQ